MLNNILQPEINNNLLKKYHSSGKLILPLLLPSIVLSKYNVNPNIKKTFDVANVLNLGYHSYVSTSCVITDYVKPKTLSTLTRSLSLSSHGIAMFGMIYYIFKNK